MLVQPPIDDLVIFKVRRARGGTWLCAPYIKPKEDVYSHSSAASNPLHMSYFVDHVHWAAEQYGRMILWDNDDHYLPSKLSGYSFKKKKKKKRMLRGALQECRMIVVGYEGRTMCKGDASKGSPDTKEEVPFFLARNWT